jgi:hypothetical protein
MMPTREELLATADALPVRPVAIEAQWDGDTDGWRVWLAAVLPDGVGYRSHHLATFQDGGDIRLFNGQVPPWPEARAAATFGTELAARFGVPFYFPSPDHPEDDCPGWAERDRGYPCRRCGILLLQRNDPCPWRGVCYHCHLDEEREKKEALWTPEERAGPRCHICGNPAKATRGESWMCPSCLERYEDYRCSRCGVAVRIIKTEPHTDLCPRCDIRARLDRVPAERREAIRAAFATGGKFVALRVAKDLLGWGLYDALSAVRELSKQAEPGASADGGGM